MLFNRLFTVKLSVVCFLLAFGGCCQQKGYLIRSDISLELNRVPWHQDECDSCGGNGCVGCGQGISEQLPAPPADVASAQTMSRFHTVPTRPAFGPTPAEQAGFIDMDGGYTMDNNVNNQAVATNQRYQQSSDAIHYTTRRRGVNNNRQVRAQSNPHSWIFPNL